MKILSTISKILFVFFSLSVFGCSKSLKFDKVSCEIVRSDSTHVQLYLELARSELEQQHGFMHRNSIPDNTGMLFIYTADKKLRFWMKNTPHPLSIAFLDSDGYIKEIRHMTPFSTETIVSTYSVRYALEVPHGWFEINNIGVGDVLLVHDMN